MEHDPSVRVVSTEMSVLQPPRDGEERKLSYREAISGSPSSGLAPSGGAGGDTQSEKDLPVTISFSDLDYSVERPVRQLSLYEKLSGFSLSGFPKPEMTEKYLLRGVTGTIKPGTMTALMGPSGAGKSTLLDVIAGRKTAGNIAGELLFNGQPFSKELKRIVGYVEQTDTLLGTLTVRELLTYTAELKLPAAMPMAIKEKRVQEVIDELGLHRCADSIIGSATIRGISGGQAKRVNIGIELITNPRVLFLDEPTTGLDAATSFEVMSVVRGIANRGRSVIATIHQPSTDVFNLFNRLLLLVAGEVVYLGEIKDSIPYFIDLGFNLPEGMNPAEFLITVTGDPTSSDGVKTIEGPDVPKGYFAAQYRKSNLAQDRLQSAAASKASAAAASKIGSEPVQFQNTARHNFGVLTRRFFMQKRRDLPFFMARFMKIFFLDFVLGTLFSNQGHSQAAVYNIVSIIMFTTMTFGFGSVGLVGTFVEQRPFFTRERNAATYQVSSWYFANLVTDLPYNVGQVLTWSICIYFAVGLRSGASAFFLWCMVVYIVMDVGLGMAQMFACLAADYESAMVMAFPVLLLSFVFSGFYVQKPLIPDYFIWAYYISFLSYGLNALALNQFSGPTSYTYSTNCQMCTELTGLVCPSGATLTVQNATNYCCTAALSLPQPWLNSELLAFWGFGSNSATSSFWLNVLALGIMWPFFKLAAYLALRFKKHGKR
eukprot:Opistho-2@56272